MRDFDNLPDPNSPLERLVADKTILNVIHDCVVTGEEEALNRCHYGDLPIKRGSYAHFSRDTLLHTKFASMGWDVSSPFSQRRIVSPPGYFSVPIRLLHIRGRVSYNEVTMRRKGRQTAALVMANFRKYDVGQKHFAFADDISLIIPDETPDMLSVWIVTTVSKEPVGERVYIHLVLPLGINSQGTVMTCAEHALLPFEPHVLGSARIDLDTNDRYDDLPQGFDIDFPIIRKREEFHDDSQNDAKKEDEDTTESDEDDSGV